jgi:hypothetical protein
MKRRFGFVVVAAFLVVALAVAVVVWNARGSSATGSTSNSKLAFAAPGTHLGTPSDLFVIDSDGSSRQLVARCPIGSGDSVWLRFPFGCTVRSFA